MHLTNLDESRWFDTNFQKLIKGNQYKKLRIVNSLILIMRLNDPNKDSNQNEVTFLCTIRYLLLRKNLTWNIDDDQGEINGRPQDIIAQVPQKFFTESYITSFQAKYSNKHVYAKQPSHTHSHMSWAQSMLSWAEDIFLYMKEHI